MMFVKIKIMPEGVETDLKKIEEKIKKLEVDIKKIEKKEIAFGLKALEVTFLCEENFNLEELQKKIKTLDGVNSAEVIDMRRDWV